MPRLSTLIAIFMCLFAVAPAHALDGGRYGDVRLATPAGTPRGYVVLFSDAGGWTAADQARLDSLAKIGALAVGVDTDAYLARVASVEAPCDQLVGDVEGLSRQLQRDHGGAEYFFPILTGVGEGGALAGAILAQTPPATLGGGVSLDPWAVVQTRHGFCARVPSDGDQPHYWRVPILNRFWSVALTPETPEMTRAHFETLQTLSPKLAVQTLSARTPDQTLASLVAPHLIPDDFSRVDGLPLVELPASSPSRLMAVFLSGDGGWRDIDKTIAENLQSLGVSVVGWDRD